MVAGHELIHAYHDNKFKGVVSQNYTEFVAYVYSGYTAINAGWKHEGRMLINKAATIFGGSGSLPNSYWNLPFVTWPFNN